MSVLIFIVLLTVSVLAQEPEEEELVRQAIEMKKTTLEILKSIEEKEGLTADELDLCRKWRDYFEKTLKESGIFNIEEGGWVAIEEEKYAKFDDFCNVATRTVRFSVPFDLEIKHEPLSFRDIPSATEYAPEVPLVFHFVASLMVGGSALFLFVGAVRDLARRDLVGFLKKTAVFLLLLPVMVGILRMIL